MAEESLAAAGTAVAAGASVNAVTAAAVVTASADCVETEVPVLTAIASIDAVAMTWSDVVANAWPHDAAAEDLTQSSADSLDGVDTDGDNASAEVMTAVVAAAAVAVDAASFVAAFADASAFGDDHLPDEAAADVDDVAFVAAAAAAPRDLQTARVPDKAGVGQQDDESADHTSSDAWADRNIRPVSLTSFVTVS